MVFAGGFCSGFRGWRAGVRRVACVVPLRGVPLSRSELVFAGWRGADGVGMAGVDGVCGAVAVDFGDFPVGVFQEEQGEYEDAGDGEYDEHGGMVVHGVSFSL